MKINPTATFFSLFFIVFAACTSWQKKEKVDPNQEFITQYEHYIEKEIAEEKLPGAEVIIVKNDTVLMHVVKGYSDFNLKKPLEKNSIYYIQSMTKPIISIAIMQLIEKGLLDLDDPVSDYIPEINQMKVALSMEEIHGASEPITTIMTIRQLLTHTAGFSHGLGDNPLEQYVYDVLYGKPMNYNVFSTLEERVQALLTLPLIGQPGKQWHYSAAPDLLGLIIEKISNQTLAEYLQEHIFNPLGMTDTGYNITPSEAGRFMAFHLFDTNERLVKSEIQVPTTGNTIFGGTHGLFSTPIDYLQFCQMIVNHGSLNGHQIVAPETLLEMRKNQVGDLYGQEGKGFGLGFEVILNSEATKEIQNTGQLSWSGYFRTHFFIHPEQKLIGIWMTQMHPYSNDYGDKLQEFAYKAIR